MDRLIPIGSNTKQILTTEEYLLPCRRLPILMGNVMDTTILELYKNSTIIKELQKKEISRECNFCLKASFCRGGVKCLSYALHQNYNRKVENCYYCLYNGLEAYKHLQMGKRKAVYGVFCEYKF